MQKKHWWVIPILMAAILMLAAPGYARQEDDRGAYIAVIGGCVYCHSPANGAPLSGGAINWDGQELYTPNLTPAESGLGNWSAEEIKIAITTGLRPDGSQMHPAMPYQFYNGMAAADLESLVAYLQALAPVKQDIPANDMSSVNLPSAPSRSDDMTAPDIADQVAYGEYLVEAVAACGGCHTPLNEDGTRNFDLHLTGGTRFDGYWGTVYAGNITPDNAEGLGPYSEDAILIAITAGRHPTERRPMYAMPAYQTLHGSDVQAIVAYLQTLPPIYNGVPADSLQPSFETYPRQELDQAQSTLTTILLIGMVVSVLVYVAIRQYRNQQRIKDTDWQEYFTDVLTDAREKEEQPQDDKTELS